ncbi:MAG TPA: AraD1 family protein [Bryobacteraceae bacterium]|nr:AraD1 family protein [Bryobacteraceae bacterium]
MIRLVQLKHFDGGRAVARVSGKELHFIESVSSVYELAQQALRSGQALAKLAQDMATGWAMPYDAIYNGDSEWKLLPPFDHPAEPARCSITGTGLTHKASVDNRNAMHAAQVQVTDSMRMYQWGLEGGKPAADEIGASPEWFYKGNGTILRAHGEPLEIPDFAEDGGEESEIAGVYLVDPSGLPRRVGMAQGNEFSDHIFEKKNYLYLASSKLRQCSLGPELILDPEFESVPGKARIHRGTAVLWEKDIRSGESAMCHSLQNMEHHHFKFPLHRRGGDVHIHFFGASAFSFGDQIQLREGDVMEVNYQGFGRPLKNPVKVIGGPAKLAQVSPL